MSRVRKVFRDGKRARIASDVSISNASRSEKNSSVSRDGTDYRRTEVKSRPEMLSLRKWTRDERASAGRATES